MSLHDAARNNDVPALKVLIFRGADVNGGDRWGASPLIYAARKNNIECVKVLLETNANVNHADGDGWMPLHWASKQGHIECVRVRMRVRAFTLLLTFFCRELLIKHNAKVCVQSKFQSAPLHYAAFCGQFACIEVRSLSRLCPLDH